MGDVIGLREDEGEAGSEEGGGGDEIVPVIFVHPFTISIRMSWSFL